MDIVRLESLMLPTYCQKSLGFGNTQERNAMSYNKAEDLKLIPQLKILEETMWINYINSEVLPNEKGVQDLEDIYSLHSKLNL